MRTFRSILRGFLVLQAAVMLLIGALGILGAAKTATRTAASPVAAAHSHSALVFALAISAALLVLGAINAIAWWTTRMPSAKPSIWALAASAVNLAQGLLLALSSHLLHASRTRFSPAEGLLFLAIGAAGIYVFSRRETSLQTAALPKAVSLAGDRTSIWTRHAVTALSTIAQIAAILFWSRWGFTHHLLRFHGLAWIALITAASIATTVIHECGHAVLAWCFEMQLRSFKAGPFQWTSREGNWNFHFHAAGLFTPAGSISVTPSVAGQSAWEFILMIAGGPGANLLFGTAAAWAVLHDRWATYQQTWELIAFTGAFCLIGSVLNLIPFLSEEGTYSDGARILQIATRSPLLNAQKVPATEAIPNTLPVAVPMPEPQPVAVAAPVFAPTPSFFMPARVVLAPGMASAAAVVSAVPGPTLSKPARTMLVPGSIRPVEAATLINSVTPAFAPPSAPPGAAPPSEPIAQAVEASAVLPTMAAESDPEPEIDPLVARFLGVITRKPPPPARQTAEPPRVLQVPAAPSSASLSIAATAPAAISPSVVALAAPAAPVLAAPAPAAAVTFDASPLITDNPTLPSFGSSSGQSAEKGSANEAAFTPASPFAAKNPLSAAVPTSVADSIPINVPSIPASSIPAYAAEVATNLPAPPQPVPSPALSQLTPTGVIASATRIPSSAFSSTPRPSATRTMSVAEPPAASSVSLANGVKAPAVPPAFARRPRPAPLMSGLPDIREILATAATAADDLALADPIAVEETIAPAQSATVSESVPLGPTFSETWPPRPTPAQPEPTQSQNHAAMSLVSPSTPAPDVTAASLTPTLDALTASAAIEEEPEPRYDPFEFLRATAIENLTANPH